jgi:hypothetical protein
MTLKVDADVTQRGQATLPNLFYSDLIDERGQATLPNLSYSNLIGDFEKLRLM